MLPLLGGAQPAGAADIEGTEASFQWQAATGPVAGYRVFVTRNGSPGASFEQSVAGTSATVSGAVGDQIAVRVAAFDSAGTEGPLSPASENVVFIASGPPPPVTIAFEASADTSLFAARAAATAGEQVSARISVDTGSKVLLDAGIPAEVDLGEDPWGVDQLVVGTAEQPTTVRLVDSIGLAESTPLVDLPAFTLFGLGSGEPCARDGEAGLVIHEGSELVLGGLELHAFDGQECVHVNALFTSSADPNRVAWGDGEIVLHGDLEEDGVLDPEDNCLLVANWNQCDTDRDGFGNVCDFDVDGNGATDFADLMDVIDATRVNSTDGRYDLDCDGAAGLSDIPYLDPTAFQTPGPSGLACAADASCVLD